MMQQNMEAAHMFIEALAGSVDAHMTFQAFDDNARRKDKSLTQVINGTLSQAWPELVRLNNLGAGIFATINETDQTGRKEENIRRRRAYFADFDLKPGEMPYDKAEQLMEPTIAVESSPGKMHAYWKLTADVPPDQWKRTQAAIISRFHTDPQCKDQSRVLRLPGMFHRKDGGWNMVSIRKIGGPEYRQEQILAVFGAAKATDPVFTSPADPFAIKENQVEGDGRRDQLLTECGRVYAAGGTVKDAKLAMKEYAALYFKDEAIDWENICKMAADLYRKHKKDNPEPAQKEISLSGQMGDSLLREFYPPLFCLSAPFIHEGTSIISGPPKIGKTTLERQIMASVSSGVDLFGNPCQKGRVLFLSLEEGPRSTQRKLIKQGWMADQLNNLEVFYEWPRGREGAELLARKMEASPDIRLITIDSYVKFTKPPMGGKTSQHSDHSGMSDLTALTKHYAGLTIRLIAHNRNTTANDSDDNILESVSGTSGVVGGVDTVWVIKSVNGRFRLHIEGREWDSDNGNDFELERTDGEKWGLVGAWDSEALPLNATGQKQMLDLIRANGRIGTASLAHKMGCNHTNVRKLGKKLKGKVAFTMDVWHLVDDYVC